MARERFFRELGDGLTLVQAEMADADALFALVDASRMHLREWLPWVDANVSVEETREFLREAERQSAAGEGFQCCIRHRGRIAGVIGFYRLDGFHRSAEIGYWLAESLQGRGIVTRSCRSLIRHAFVEMGLHRLEIRAAVGNRRSRAVAERLGFVHEGTLRESQRLEDRFLDLAVYGVLRGEWEACSGG